MRVLTGTAKAIPEEARVTTLAASLGAAGGFAGAPLGARGIGRGFANEFGIHHAGDEKLPAVVVEIDRCAFGVGLVTIPRPYCWCLTC